MPLNLDIELKGPDGKPIIMAEATEARAAIYWNLRTAAQIGLTNYSQAGGRKLPGEEQHKRYMLATLIMQKKEPILKSADIVLIKECVADWFQSPLLTGAVYEAIEPTVEGEDKKPPRKK